MQHNNLFFHQVFPHVYITVPHFQKTCLKIIACLLNWVKNWIIFKAYDEQNGNRCHLTNGYLYLNRDKQEAINSWFAEWYKCMHACLIKYVNYTRYSLLYLYRHVVHHCIIIYVEDSYFLLWKIITSCI